jgi:hypothetical protein
MPRTQRIFTAYNLFRIRQMAEDGCSAIEIAESIASTPGSVKVICSRYKIKLVRKIKLAGGRGSTRPPSTRIVVDMPPRLATEFHRKAKHLQIPASVLARRLLAAIVVSNIYEAVLDDEDESPGESKQVSVSQSQDLIKENLVAVTVV